MFKPRGAERKQRAETARIQSLDASERAYFQMPTSDTRFLELPPQHPSIQLENAGSVALASSVAGLAVPVSSVPSSRTAVQAATESLAATASLAAHMTLEHTLAAHALSATPTDMSESYMSPMDAVAQLPPEMSSAAAAHLSSFSTAVALMSGLDSSAMAVSAWLERCADSRALCPTTAAAGALIAPESTPASVSGSTVAPSFSCESSPPQSEIDFNTQLADLLDLVMDLESAPAAAASCLSPAGMSSGVPPPQELRASTGAFAANRSPISRAHIGLQQSSSASHGTSGVSYSGSSSSSGVGLISSTSSCSRAPSDAECCAWIQHHESVGSVSSLSSNGSPGSSNSAEFICSPFAPPAVSIVASAPYVDADPSISSGGLSYSSMCSLPPSLGRSASASSFANWVAAASRSMSPSATDCCTFGNLSAAERQQQFAAVPRTSRSFEPVSPIGIAIARDVNAHMTPELLQHWLFANRFASLVDRFRQFDGSLWRFVIIYYCLILSFS